MTVAERRKSSVAEVNALRAELRRLEALVEAASQASEAGPASATQGPSLEDAIRSDQRRLRDVRGQAEQQVQELVTRQSELAKDAFGRLDRRLSRLIRRARLGRIETVLGKKRALEVEVEALSRGLLPADAVDSLEAARYLQDDEEYWPHDGEDWADEYVGGEGLQ
jgi:hypothetical protein